MSERTRSDASRLWYRLLRLQLRTQVAVAKRMKPLGLSIPQCDILATLSEREGISQQDLAARLYVTKGNISGLVDRLVGLDLVERRVFENDRRSHAIYLTPTGRRLAKAAIHLQKKFADETLGRLSEQQIADFEALVIATRDLVREWETPRPNRRALVGRPREGSFPVGPRRASV